MTFERLKFIREYEDLTQNEIAKLLNVKRSTYSLWEINKNTIPLEKLIEFCNYFNISIDFIVGLSNNNNNKINFNNIINKNEIGKRLKQIRKELNLTQNKLAKKFNTTHSTISAYENGITLIPTIFVIELAKIAKKSIDWICCRTK